eukprot:scaffold26395_cov23-Tisochrysis_lutea.AAC.2
MTFTPANADMDDLEVCVRNGSMGTSAPRGWISSSTAPDIENPLYLARLDREKQARGEVGGKDAKGAKKGAKK